MSSELLDERSVGALTEPGLHMRNIDANGSECRALVCGSLLTFESRFVGVSR